MATSREMTSGRPFPFDIEFCFFTGNGCCIFIIGLNGNIIIRKSSDDFIEDFCIKSNFTFFFNSTSTIVSIPSSISLVVNLIWFVVASMRIHSRIGIVVFDGTALSAILTLF